MVLPSAVGKLQRCARFSESVVMATKTKREENRRKEGAEQNSKTRDLGKWGEEGNERYLEENESEEEGRDKEEELRRQRKGCVPAMLMVETLALVNC